MEILDIEVEVANTESKRRTGLMYRSSLGDNKGMFFVFNELGDHTFWNKNVNFPIDIGFFNEDGELLNVRSAEKDCTLPVKSGFNNVKYVLEANKDFFQRNNISLGDRIVDLKKIEKKKEKISHYYNYITKDENYYILSLKKNIE
jgi:uncharacterized protein